MHFKTPGIARVLTKQTDGGFRLGLGRTEEVLKNILFLCAPLGCAQACGSEEVLFPKHVRHD
jgi:hypothetical protein